MTETVYLGQRASEDMVSGAESGLTPEARAQRSADQLALALEDIGFDVGRDFPLLGSGVGSAGIPFVELGRVGEGVASGLSAVLTRAARLGIGLDES